MKFKILVLVSASVVSSLGLASESYEVTPTPEQKRTIASERNTDVNTPYTPAYLEKIDSNDRESDPEYVEESRTDRSSNGSR